MSEYQYYEFRTVDRALTSDEIDKLDELSSRIEVTSTGFSIEYNYGDFRGDPERLMERYFDAFVYVANWGTRRFMIRLPRRSIDLVALKTFENESLTFWVKHEFVIISFEYNDEGGGQWEEGEGWMHGLLPLREELLNGDFRSLYLGWLSGTSYDEEFDDDVDTESLEPPVPPGLRKLSTAQETLIEFLYIDEVLVETAALNSEDLQQDASGQMDLVKWLKKVSVEKKNEWLLQLVGETGRSVRAEILSEFREARVKTEKPGGKTKAKRRSIQELFTARESHLEIYDRRCAKEAAEQQAKAAAAAAKKRRAELDALSKRADAAWKELEARLSSTSQKRFINSIKDLQDLRELAVREGELDSYRKRLEKLLKRHLDKPAFQTRVSDANLTE